MQFVACDGSITTGAGGEALCSGAWVGLSDGITLTLAELTTADIATLVSAGMVTMALAFGFRVLRKQMGF